MLSRLKAFGAVAIFALIILWFGWREYTSLQDEIRTLSTQVSMYQGRIGALESQVEFERTNYDMAQKRTERAMRDMTEASRRVDEVRQMFATSDFAYVLAGRRTLVSRQMQRATGEIFRDIERISNAPWERPEEEDEE